MIRPTRNNSYSSLASLNSHALVPLHSHLLHHPAPPILPGDYISKLNHKNSNVMLSDEDSEIETSLPPPSRTILKPVFRVKKDQYPDPSLKIDFKFKYKDQIPPNPSSTSLPVLAVMSSPYSGSVVTSPVVASPVIASQPHASATSQTPIAANIDSIPSPLSLNNTNKPHDLGDNGEHSKIVLKKNKLVPSSIQKLYLKKIYSKDLQIEMAGNMITSPVASPSSYPFPETPASSKKPSLGPLSPPAPHSSTIIDQNKLINDLNRKWNKSIVNSELPDRLKKSTLPVLLPNTVPSRKRSRGFSFSEEDGDVYDDEDFTVYDSYDFYNKAFTTSYDLNNKNNNEEESGYIPDHRYNRNIQNQQNDNPNSYSINTGSHSIDTGSHSINTASHTIISGSHTINPSINTSNNHNNINSTNISNPLNSTNHNDHEITQNKYTTRHTQNPHHQKK